MHEEALTNKVLTEHIANWRHALHFTEPYKHATLQTARSWTQPVLWYQSRVPYFTDCLFLYTFSHVWMKLYILFLRQNTDLQLLKHHLSIYCTPLVHKNILGTFAFQQTAAFHYKKVIWLQTLTTTDEKHDIKMEDRKHLKNVDIVQLQLIGPFIKDSLFDTKHHTGLKTEPIC